MKLSEQGFPYCPVCHGILYWDDSITKGEIGMVPEFSAESDDIVHCLQCHNCEREFYYMQDNNEEETLVDVSTLK